MTTATRGARVQINALAHAYTSDAATLSGINLTAEPGELVALVGASGCGKTTLLRLVAGLLEPQKGSVQIDARAPKAARGETAFIFQEPALLPWRTVAANVALRPELAGVPTRARAALVADRLALTGLTDAACKYPHELSGGMRMRASLARALAGSPRLLLMDEPFGSLDEITRQRLGSELGRLRAVGGWTTLFVTHSVAEAVFLADRVCVLGGRPGRIVGEVAVSPDSSRGARGWLEPDFVQAARAVTELLQKAEARR